MATQNTYNETMDAGRAGQIVNTEENLLVSRTNEDVALLGYGVPVSQGTDDKSVHATTTGDTVIFGVTVRERSGVAETEGWNKGESARIAIKAPIYVVASVAVVAGDIVHVIVATGAFAKTGGVLVPNARYDTSAGVGELVQLRLA